MSVGAVVADAEAEAGSGALLAALLAAVVVLSRAAVGARAGSRARAQQLRLRERRAGDQKRQDDCSVLLHVAYD